MGGSLNGRLFFEGGFGAGGALFAVAALGAVAALTLALAAGEDGRELQVELSTRMVM
jgi:hypothetical protein